MTKQPIDLARACNIVGALVIAGGTTLSIAFYKDYPPNEHLSSLGTRSPVFSDISKQTIQPPYPDLFNYALICGSVLLLSNAFLNYKYLRSLHRIRQSIFVAVVMVFAFLNLGMVGIIDLGMERPLHDQLAKNFFYAIMVAYATLLYILIDERRKRQKWQKWTEATKFMIIMYLLLLSIQRQIVLFGWIKPGMFGFIGNGLYQRLWGVGFILMVLLDSFLSVEEDQTISE